MPEPRPAPEQDAVRRLLAQARHDEPLPDDVARRLDRVLDGLKAGSGRSERSENEGEVPSLGAHPIDTTTPAATTAPAPSGTSVPFLDARRQRRRAAIRLLVAAAVVIGIGIGIGQVIGDHDDSTGSASQVQRVPSGDSGDEADSSASSASAASTAAPAGLGYAQLARRLPLELDSADLDAGARSAVRSAAELVSGLQDATPVIRALTDPLPGWSCPTTGAPSAVYGSGTLLPATFDATPVVLALRPVNSGATLVEVLTCGTGDQVARTTVDRS